MENHGIPNRTNLSGAEQEKARTRRFRAFGERGRGGIVLPIDHPEECSLNHAYAGKIAIVTGGSRGLGRNTVLRLAERGVRSIFTWHSNKADAESLLEATAAAGHRALALQLDTGDTRAFDAFVVQVRDALAEWGASGFDYLVNNAGTSHHNAIATTTEDELDGLYNVHFKGVFFLTQKLLPVINDGGRIVNISSDSPG